jgi:solute carrier family 25 (mitochondrial S-adenosylmethionine transporter), member 26
MRRSVYRYNTSVPTITLLFLFVLARLHTKSTLGTVDSLLLLLTPPHNTNNDGSLTASFDFRRRTGRSFRLHRDRARCCTLRSSITIKSEMMSRFSHTRHHDVPRRNRNSTDDNAPTASTTIHHGERIVFLLKKSSVVMNIAIAVMIMTIYVEPTIVTNAVPTVVTSNTQTTLIVMPSERSDEKGALTVQARTRVSEQQYETLSGFAAGAALTLTKTIIKYPMDTATVRLQMPNSTYSIRRPIQLFDDAYIGIAAPLFSNIPAGAVFFAVKDSVSSFLKVIAVNSATSTLLQPDVTSLFCNWFAQQCTSRTFRTCIAVAMAQIPYWIVRNPSEVVKTKEQAGIVGVTNATDENGIRSSISTWYSGYWENIIYAYPADVLKFLCYEQLSSHFLTSDLDHRDSTSSIQQAIESALFGAVSTASAQYVTTPLDVVRNRVMANVTSTTSRVYQDSVSYSNSTNTSADIIEWPLTVNAFFVTYGTSLIQLGQNEGWDGLFAGATPRLLKAFISGAIQFATYEATKQALIDLLLSSGKT